MKNNLKKFGIFMCLLAVATTTYDFGFGDESTQPKEKKEKKFNTDIVDKDVIKTQQKTEIQSDAKDTLNTTVAFNENKADQSKVELSVKDTVPDEYQYTKLRGIKGEWRLVAGKNAVAKKMTEKEIKKTVKKVSGLEIKPDSAYILTDFSTRDRIKVLEEFNKTTGELKKSYRDTAQVEIPWRTIKWGNALDAFISLNRTKNDREAVIEEKKQKQRKAQQSALRIN